MKAIKKLDTADEFVNDGTAKLDTALARSPISESSVDAAKMMLQKGNATRAEVKEELEKIREKMNALDERTLVIIYPLLCNISLNIKVKQ